MMTAPPHANQDAGFTLVEVLVSMFIFSLISVGALIALSTTLDAREAAETRLSEIEQLAATRRLMADDFAEMIYRKNRDGLGGFIDLTREAAQTDGFKLTRRGRSNPEGVFPRGDLLRVSWRVENGQLIRAFMPHENPAFVEPPVDRVVLEGVESIQVEVMSQQINSIASLLDQVRRDFTADQTLGARAVSITLTHADGTTTRHVFGSPDA